MPKANYMSKEINFEDEEINGIAINIANAFVTTNEKLKNASEKEFIDIYLNVLNLAQKEASKRNENYYENWNKEARDFYK